MMRVSLLTSKDKAYIKRNRMKLSGTEMARRIGVKKSVVNRYMRKNNLTPPKEVIIRFRSESMTGRTTFTKEEDAYIKKNYLKVPVKVVAESINRSEVGVVGRMKAMGLEVPDDIKQRNIAAVRFKKGQIAHNKGKKIEEFMTREAIKRSSSTRFKKGHLPHNTKWNGCKSIRRDPKTGIHYIYIRVALGKWKEYHRYRWEMFRGKIPKGMVLRFRDGNTMNCKLSNLELISMKENMQRNSKLNLPPEVQEAINIISGFNRKLNKIIKDEGHQ